MRTIIINAKASDLCHTEYIVDGETKIEADGYCPNLKGISGGDYISLEIDLDTGKILNYKPISHSDIMNELSDEFYDEDEEEQTFENGLNTDKNHPEVIEPSKLDSGINNY